MQSFFEFAAKRFERRFNKKVCLVAKSEITILYNFLEILSKNDSLTLEKSRLETKKDVRKEIGENE